MKSKNKTEYYKDLYGIEKLNETTEDGFINWKNLGIYLGFSLLFLIIIAALINQSNQKIYAQIEVLKDEVVHHKETTLVAIQSIREVMKTEKKPASKNPEGKGTNTPDPL